MNQDWQEKRMRQLFRELREQDEQQAPAFANVLETALASQRPAQSAWRVWRLATVIALLIVVIGSVFFFIKASSTEPTIGPQGSLSPRVPELPNQVAPAPSLSEGYARAAMKPEPGRSQNRYPKKVRSLFGRHKQLPTQNLQLTMLISKWQSPTGSLLKLPGAELFNTIPRVGEPLFEMKSLVLNEKN